VELLSYFLCVQGGLGGVLQIRIGLPYGAWETQRSAESDTGKVKYVSGYGSLRRVKCHHSV